jgi:hypothetical protein
MVAAVEMRDAWEQQAWRRAAHGPSSRSSSRSASDDERRVLDGCTTPPRVPDRLWAARRVCLRCRVWRFGFAPGSPQGLSDLKIHPRTRAR